MPRDHSAEIARLEQVIVQHRNGAMGAEARVQLDRLLREIADVEAADRHREAILETQASRRLDKWALTVAAVALLVGGAGLWRSFLPAVPEHLSPVSASSVPEDHADPILGSTSKISKPAQTPVPPLPVQSPDEKLKAIPTRPQE